MAQRGVQGLRQALTQFLRSTTTQMGETESDDGGPAIGPIANQLRQRLGPTAVPTLFLSVLSTLFVFAVLGESFSSVSTDYSSTAAAPPASATTSASESADLGNSTIIKALNMSVAALQPVPSPLLPPGSIIYRRTDNKSSLFYWLLALGTLLLFLAIIRSLVILRRAASERGAAERFSFSYTTTTSRSAGTSRTTRTGRPPAGMLLTNIIGGNFANFRSHLALMGRENFTANDYEVLSQLDVINQSLGQGQQQRGATEQMINRLPLHNMTLSEIESKAGTNAAQCTICMEMFAEGDVVRVVTCMHSFHKDCLDPWLRLHPTCPICKISITNVGEEGL